MKSMLALLKIGSPPIAAAALVAQAGGEITGGPWIQAGVAGLALFVLFIFATRTVPKMLREGNESHERSMSQLCENIKTLTSAISGNRGNDSK